MKQGKLELTWVGKDERPRLEPRVLVEDPANSYGDPKSENMLIFGDNLLALKALEQDFTGKIKCIYIDPPFNTGAAFEYYDDGIEHSVWLSLMRDRLELLRTLLTPDGVFFVHIDDKEMAYLRILCDELFGRNQFLNMVVVKTSDPSGHKTVNPSPYSQTEYILMYARDRGLYKYEQRYVETNYDSGYNRVVLNRSEAFESWQFGSLNETVARTLGYEEVKLARKKMGRVGFEAVVAQYALEHAKDVFQLVAISDAAGRRIVEARNESANHPGRVYRVERDRYDDIHILNGRQIYFYAFKVRVVDGERCPAKPLTNLWTDIPWNGISREGSVEFKNGKKPERLVKRCIEISTNPGDLVLDSFAGSGTTGAAAHKMGRRWIMVELGEHCHTHIIPRMKKVVDGTDQGGISEAVGWKGGGGFKYYRLAESLLVRDKELSTKDHPVYVINPRYDETLLIRGICKISGFKYRHDGRLHGISSENRFLHVTTRLVTQMYLDSLGEDIAKDQSLVIYCTRRVGKLTVPDNIEIRKIPRDLLEKCDFEEDK